MTMAWAFSIFMSLQIFYNCFGIKEPKIDAEHLAKYPNCGELKDTAKARIANAIPSSIRYPWALLLVRRFTGPKPGNSKCGANIITKK